jgi:endonuclease YncB( thermonuclease family)
MNNLRRLTTLIASLALAASLAACSGASDDSGSAASQSAGPSASQSAEPTVYTRHSVRVKEVLSGDTVRVTITGDSVDGSIVDRAESDYEDLVVRVLGIDAPDEGECGFDEATAQMTSIALDGGYGITAIDDGTGAQLADEDEHLVFSMSNRIYNPGRKMLTTGYARLWTPVEWATDYDYGQDEVKAQEAGEGLWASCFAE